MQQSHLLANTATILVVPCFNEEKRIVVADFCHYLKANPENRIVFVNDGSKDDTLKTLGNIESSCANATIITIPKNGGKGEAVRAGIMHAIEQFDCDYIGFADADLSTPLSEFEEFERILCTRPEVNLVMGSRVQMLGREINRDLLRHWFGRIIATFICKVLDEPVYDTQCGAKLFRKSIAEDLFCDAFISKWLFDVEVLARYKKSLGAGNFAESIIESPVSRWTEKEDSKLKYRYFFRIIFDLARIRYTYFRN